MELATPEYFSRTRDTSAWQSRGLLALYGFGVASLIAAVVTFIAHNWTYLGTGVKLGGIGAAIIICAAVWGIKRFDSLSAQSFGIAAQVLIGVWLAAAGQIYQAPGGLQDLLLIWAVLGLPFALASRSAAHWAVWFAVIVLAAVSPMGLRLLSAIGPDFQAMILLSGGLILGVGLVVAFYKEAPIWFLALLSIGVSVLCVWASWFGLFDADWLGHYGPSFIALIVVSVLGWRSYVTRTVSTTAILSSASMVVFVSIIAYFLAELLDDGFLFFFVMTGLVCAGTYGMVLVFKHLCTFIETHGDSEAAPDDNPWYMDALIGAGGVATTGFACGLIAMIIGLSGLLEDNWEVSLLVIGAGVYGLSIFIRRTTSGQFIRFVFGTFILVGIGCLGVFAYGAVNSELVTGLTFLVLAIATVWLVSGDRILSALMAVTACFGILFIFLPMEIYSLTSAALMSLYIALGLAFGTIRFRGRVHQSFSAFFLLAAISVGLAADVGLSHISGAGWTEFDIANVLIAVFGGLWLWFTYCRELGPSWPVLTALLLIAIILPVGAVPAMLLLILAYAIGSRALFLIGVIAMAWFLFSAYFDLSMTLMELSGVMAAVGVGLLGLWAFASKRVEIAS
jgi:hypothetical protein